MNGSFLRRAFIGGAAGAVVPLVFAASVSALWSVGGSGGAAGRALVMPAGMAPTATLSGADVIVRWQAATLGGVDVAGYVIRRYDANGTSQTVGPGCAGVVTSTTCAELGVPSGSWTYTDTPVQENWTGIESPAGSPVTVP